jgi:metal-responsive CopG/Arc/MetJ family transcriptional regulator
MPTIVISLPDELLRRLDARARQRGMSRGALLRLLAEQELADVDRQRQARVAELLGQPGRYGGGAASDVRRLRRGR